ncbi:aminopeptidase [Erysipelothrix sp. Poltava]|nr:aminopeptidase [Erysipelothrix sp. Poltava]
MINWLHKPKAQGQALKRMREYTMANRGQWSLVSLPTKEWAHVVFPDLEIEEAYEKLLEAYSLCCTY